MIKDFFQGLLFLAISLFIQLFWSMKLGIKGVIPDFVLITIIFLSFQKNPIFGLLMGFCGGVLMYSSTGFGYAGLMISRILIGVLTSFTTKSFSKDNVLIMIISVLWLTPLSYLVMMFANPRPLLLGIEMMLYGTVLNLILMLILIGIRFLFFKDRKNYYLD